MSPTRRQSTSRHFKLTIAYDGTAYGGWQRQPNALTIQELVERAVEKIQGVRFPPSLNDKLRRPGTVHGSGRTDAGVHARAQVASCSLVTRHAPMTLRRALNGNLPVDIRVRRVQEVAAGFHARFSAKGKEYRYQIDCGTVADPFRRAYAWHHPYPLDLALMRRAARALRGRHDFSALAANPLRPVEDPRRTISRLTVQRAGELVTIAVRADGFLYKMVRSIVGALVKVGEGRLTVAQLERVLRSRKRTALIETAPAHGLFLWQVYY